MAEKAFLGVDYVVSWDEVDDANVRELTKVGASGDIGWLRELLGLPSLPTTLSRPGGGSRHGVVVQVDM